LLYTCFSNETAEGRDNVYYFVISQIPTALPIDLFMAVTALKTPKRDRNHRKKQILRWRSE